MSPGGKLAPLLPCALASPPPPLRYNISMKRTTLLCYALAALLLVAAGCSKPRPTVSLATARKGFVTKVRVASTDPTPPDLPPPGCGVSLVTYPSPVGALPAYLSDLPRDGRKHPAIVWITGGDCNSIGDVWKPASPDNDQTARAFREAGIVTLYPTLRGGNTTQSRREGFYGEADDIAAAAQFLASQPGVDAQRIYLGGHSTGGTMVLIAAEAHPQAFRAVFSFGPVDRVDVYGDLFPGLDRADAHEIELRSPVYWLGSLSCPTFVLEGTGSPNLACLETMKGDTHNPNTHFYPVPDATHFSTLAPLTRTIAKKILADTGSTSTITFAPDDLTLHP